MSKPLFSICIPTRNRAHLIGRALDSCIAQTYGNLEIIVCDNASEDRTREVVSSYCNKDSRFRYLKSEKNVGQTRNIFKVFTSATGEYVQYLADDNWLADNYVEEKIRSFKENPDVGLVSSAFMKYKPASRGLQIFAASRQESGIKSAKFVFDTFYRKESCLGIICSARRKDMLEALSAFPNVPNAYHYNYLETHIGFDLLPFIYILSKYPALYHTNRTLYHDLMTPSEIEDQSIVNLVEYRHQYRIAIEHAFSICGLQSHIPAFRRYSDAITILEVFKRIIFGPRTGIGFSSLSRYFKGYAPSDWVRMASADLIPLFMRQVVDRVQRILSPEAS